MSASLDGSRRSLLVSSTLPAAPPVVHLVSGFLGSGKTTFSKALAAREGAIRFSVDELYLQLFSDGPTAELDQRALDRLLSVLNDLWPQVVAAGTSVVLDLGFWRRSLRDEVRQRAKEKGAVCQLYWLRCSDEVALARCLSRNGDPGSFLISAEGFAELKPRFQLPGADEAYEVVDTS
jgi:predicted kinase